jgi:uncharacterized membrane protein
MLRYLSSSRGFVWECDVGWRTIRWLVPVMTATSIAASLVFGLLLLLSITGQLDDPSFLSWLSVCAAFLLTLSCVAALLYFIKYAAVRSDVNTVLVQILADLKRTLQEMRSVSESASAIEPASLEPEFSLLSPASGYLQRVDYKLLVQAAHNCRAVITLLHRPGDFVLAGSILAVGTSDGDQGPVPRSKELLFQVFANAVTLGPRRSMHQDPEYAIAQILEIGCLSMSPAISNPLTALKCIDALSAGLRDILQACMHNRVHTDRHGHARVIEQDIPSERVLRSALDPLRQATKNSVALTVRVLNAIGSLAPFLNAPNQSLELRAQAELILEGACSDTVLRDRADIETAYVRARQALACPYCQTEIDLLSPTWQETGFSEIAP